MFIYIYIYIYNLSISISIYFNLYIYVYIYIQSYLGEGALVGGTNSFSIDRWGQYKVCIYKHLHKNIYLYQHIVFIYVYSYV
jgi:hypothetical protein